MNSIVCTLFEGNYYYGVAALINSLHANGFTGEVYVGYRGEVTNWTAEAKPDNTIDWPDAKSLKPAAALTIYFLPVHTTRHLANYKAVFMMQLMKYTDAGVVYVDPDIVVKCDWSFFERWLTYGVAVVQEISSNQVSPNHPKRARWKQVIESCNRTIQRDLYYYFNSGFCGVSKKNTEFLETWEQIMDTAINKFEVDEYYFSKKDQLLLFPAFDQDILNIAAMCSISPISDFGPEGMDFIYGGWLMSHATGKPKPWANRFIRQALRGKKISQAEKNYWVYADGLIKSMPASLIKRKRLAIQIGSLINRFYSRS